MSAHAFIFQLLAMGAAVTLAIFSGPISAAAVSFFYGPKNRRVRK